MSNKKYFPIIVAIVFSFLTFSCKKDSILEQGQYVYVNGKLVQLAKITTKEVSDVTSSTAVCGGNVTSDGGMKVSARGVCWSSLQMPTINDNHTMDGEGVGDFTSNITGLMADSTYYVRAYATSEAGTVYGEQRVFITSTAEKPTVTTYLVEVTSTSATCGGNVTSSGGANVTERGVCWSTSHNPTINDNHIINGSGLGDFTCNITGLIKGTTYYVRAYATNRVGTAYGEEKNFVATDGTPIVTTNPVSNITHTSAVCGGNVISSGNSNVTARGVCWSTNPNPTLYNSDISVDGTGTGSFTSSLIGLSAGTTYYVRAYATNSAGTSYGEQRFFTTTIPYYGQPCPGAATMTDYDGNSYPTVIIGNQCWMAKNLRTTHYANGTSISLGSSSSTTTAYYYYPNGSSSTVPTYGLLYNWKAVMWNSSSSDSNPSGVQGICPNGWHVPSEAEWNQLCQYLGSHSQYWCGNNSNRIAKSLASSVGWSNCDDGTCYDDCCVGDHQIINNSTGFNAFPAGYYGTSGAPLLKNFSDGTCFWSSTYLIPNVSSTAYPIIYNANFFIGYGNPLDYGFSVRCLRN